MKNDRMNYIVQTDVVKSKYNDLILNLYLTCNQVKHQNSKI